MKTAQSDTAKPPRKRGLKVSKPVYGNVMLTGDPEQPVVIVCGETYNEKCDAVRTAELYLGWMVEGEFSELDDRPRPHITPSLDGFEAVDARWRELGKPPILRQKSVNNAWQERETAEMFAYAKEIGYPPYMSRVLQPPPRTYNHILCGQSAEELDEMVELFTWPMGARELFRVYPGDTLFRRPHRLAVGKREAECYRNLPIPFDGRFAWGGGDERGSSAAIWWNRADVDALTAEVEAVKFDAINRHVLPAIARAAESFVVKTWLEVNGYGDTY